MTDGTDGTDLLELTAQIVAAQVSYTGAAAVALPAVIRGVFRTLSAIGQAPAAAGRPEPAVAVAVAVRRSVFPDYIVCLEDGKKLKMLKRHLQTAYGMTPKAYRERWDLPPDYPMVAPGYASHRSDLARRTGLGRKSGGDA